VGRQLAKIDAVRKQRINYKPDAFTRAGEYAWKSPGEVAIFAMAPPYKELHEYTESLQKLATLIDAMRKG